MKTIIAGSREFTDLDYMSACIEALDFTPTVIISGTARGADRLGEVWASKHSIPIDKFPADWNRYGNSAGFIRNQEMAAEGDVLLAFWNGKSKGTNHMIATGRRRGLRVIVFQDWK